MFIATGYIGELAPATITWRRSLRSSTPGSSWDFNDVPVGTADASRYVLVWALPGNGSVVRVNGSNASQVGSTAWFIRSVPTGTTVDIQLNADGSFTSSAIQVWTMTNLLSSSARDTDTVAQSITTPKSGSVSVLRGGVVAAAGWTSVAGVNTQGYSWGGSGVDSDTTGTTPVGGIVISAAHANPTATGSQSVSLTRTAGTNAFGLDLISYR